MKKQFFFLAFTLLSMSLFAERLEDRFVSRSYTDGMLYFIEPFQLPSISKKEPIFLDVTYLTSQDSITLNMSVYYNEILQIDSICFVYDDTLKISKLLTFFIEKEKNKFVHRHSCRIPYFALLKMYQNEKQPFTMELFTDKGVFLYSYGKKWEKERSWMIQIFQLISKNRRKG